MKIISLEHLEDRVRVCVHLTKPYGIPDEHRVVEVRYDAIPDLPKPPIQIGEGINFHQDIFVPRLNRPITFVVDSFCESSSGPNEERLYGPYLKEVA